MAVASVMLVVDADEMDDETFFKHVNRRHGKDFINQAYSPKMSEGLIKSMRAFHRLCHKSAPPDKYDHEHEES